MPPTPPPHGAQRKNWIAGAIQHPGALHRQLHVPQGQKIPAKKLRKAENSDNPLLARRARLADTLGGLTRGQSPKRAMRNSY